MPRGKLSLERREKLCREIRDRVTSGEKRSVVARALAAKYRVSPTAVYWHMGKELVVYGQRETRSSSRRKSGRRVGMMNLQAEFDRLLERDMEIRKAHAEVLAGIHELNLRAAKSIHARVGSQKPLLTGRSGAREASPPGLQTFGSRVKELRKARGMTLEEVAQKVGTHKGYVSGIELGRVRPPSAKFVSKFARVFSIDERELHRLACVEKAPPQIRGELVRAFWPTSNRAEDRGSHRRR
jgi:transcriptional regulator with XRE-family HTH domain